MSLNGCLPLPGLPLTDGDEASEECSKGMREANHLGGFGEPAATFLALY
jgi:hypothetical protein